LRQRYKKSQPARTTPASDLKTEAFVGMWQDREDMQESTDWVRSVRQSHWESNVALTIVDSDILIDVARGEADASNCLLRFESE